MPNVEGKGNQRRREVFPGRRAPFSHHAARRNVVAAGNRKGIFVVVSAVMLTALFGFLALATDLGWLYHQRRLVQVAADAGALYGAYQIRRGANATADVESLSDHGVLKGTSDNGFTDGDNAVVTVEYPPATGGYVGNNRAVEVTVCSQQRTFFMPVFGTDSADVCARAVAGHLGQGEGCIYALNLTEPKTMYVHSNTVANVGCGVIVNSNDPGALDVTSDACMTTGSVSVGGSDAESPDANNFCGYGNGESVNVDPHWYTPPEEDPLWELGVPPEVSNGCDQTQFQLDDPAKIPQLQPGRYCKGLKIDCDTCGTIIMPAGNYVIAGERLEIVGLTTVQGSGVMIYATDFPAQVIQAKGILIGSGPTVTLSAPTSGDFEGILLYVDRDLDPADGHLLGIEISSGASVELHGALYTLNGTVLFHSAVSGSNLAHDGIAIVADKVEISSLGSGGGGPTMNVTEDFGDFATGSPIKRVTLLE